MPGMDHLWNAEHLTPVERAVHLARVRASIHAAYEVLGANLQAALAAAVTCDLEGIAKALGVPPAVVVRMATDPSTPDVPLLLRGIKIVRRRPGLPVRALIAARDATKIIGATDGEIFKIAKLLLEAASELPLDGEWWTGAKADDKTDFQQAVAYARSMNP